MTEHEQDPLHAVLREWEAPEPPAAMDARVRAAYRESRRRPSLWQRFWSFRVAIPGPVLAALLIVLAAGLWLQFRPRSQAAHPASVAPSGGGYMTRIESAGFKPLPDGATRVIRSGESRQ